MILVISIILLYNTHMRAELLPDFARPFKKKGYDVRERKGTYFLYRITSRRVPGRKYPVLEQHYIGIIGKDGKLVPKKESPRAMLSRRWLEYGLSSFIMSEHGRELSRSTFNGGGKGGSLVVLAIVRYVMGSVSDTAISSCRLSRIAEEDVMACRNSASPQRVLRLAGKIGSLQKALLGDDLGDFEILMRLCVCGDGDGDLPPYPDAAMEMLRRHQGGMR